MFGRKSIALTLGLGCAALVAFLLASRREPVTEPDSQPDPPNALLDIPETALVDDSIPNDSVQLLQIEGIALLGETGEPVAGVAIRLRRESDGEPIEPPVESGEDGAFRFVDVEPGEYSLIAEHDSLVAERQPYWFAIAKGTEARWLEVVMLDGGAVSGRVYDSSSLRGIVGVKVGLGQRMSPSTTTVANGFYTLTGVPAGEARVHREFVRDYMRRKDDAMGVRVDVREGQTSEGVDFALMKGVFASIQGKVVNEQGAAVPGAIVMAVDYNDMMNPQSNTANADGEGMFSLDNFEPTNGIYITAKSEGAASGDIGPLSLTADGISDLAVVLHPTGSLSGHVVDLDGHPVGDTGMQVKLMYRKFGHNSLGGLFGAVDETGAFRIEKLTAGSYGLYVDASPNVRTSARITPLVTIEIAAGEHLTGIELSIDYESHLASRAALAAATRAPRRERPQTVEVQGRVVHSGTNEPVELFRVRGRYSSLGTRSSDDTFGDADGRFTIRPRHGDQVELVVESDGFAPARAAFNVDEDGRVSGGELLVRLAPGAAIEGTVVDEQGAPVVGASIYVNFDFNIFDPGNFNSPDRAAVTDSEGSFYVDSLAAEPTTLYVQHPSFAPASEEVTPVRSQPAPVRIVMTSGGAIEGGIWWNGSPLRDKNMMMLNADGVNVETGGAATDADGRYRIDRVSPGLHTVYFNAGSNDVGVRLQQRLVEVTDGSTTQLDFSSPAVPAILEGSVLLDGQTPANLSFRLEIETDYGRDRISNRGWIDTGTFLAENLPSGWATLSITAIDANNERAIQTEEFQIAEGAALRRDFDLRTGP